MTDKPAGLDTGTRLAIDRTRLAHERTMMAWVRTATSLISFGFTIHKFFQYQIERQAAVARIIGPREFALIMIGTGLAALLLATVQHRQSLAELEADFVSQPRSVAGIVAILIAFMGVVAFAATLLHL